MNRISISLLLTPPKVYFTATALSGLIFFAVISGIQIQSTHEDMRMEYQVERDLAHRGSEYRQAYEQKINRSPLPNGLRPDQNEWVRLTQDLVRQNKLSLKKITPVTRKNSGVSETQLDLVVEGTVPDLLEFLYLLSQNKDWTYVSQFNISRQDRAQSVQAEISLSQR